MRIESSATDGSFLYIQVPDKVYRELFRKKMVVPLDDKYGLISGRSRKKAAGVLAGLSGTGMSGVRSAEWLLNSKGKFSKVYLQKRRMAKKRIDSHIVLTNGKTYGVSSFANRIKAKETDNAPKGVREAYAFDKIRGYGITSKRIASLALAKESSRTEKKRWSIVLEQSDFLESVARRFQKMIRNRPVAKADLDRAFLPFDKEIKDAFKHSEKIKDPTVLRGFFTHRLDQMDQRTLIRH